MHTLRRLAVIAIAGVLLAAGFATAAQAADPWQPMQRSCSVNGRLIVQSSCNTGSVQAHPTGHYVRIRVYPYSGCQFDWRLRDTVNNRVVSSGRTSGRTAYVYGLTWWYRLEVTRVGVGCGGDAIINNT